METGQAVARVLRAGLVGLGGAAAGGGTALAAGLAASLLGAVLERLLGVTLVSWELAGLITALLAAPVGAAAGLLATAPRRPLVGGALAVLLHGLVFGGLLTRAGHRPVAVDAWFLAVGLSTGLAAGVAGAVVRFVAEGVLVAGARGRPPAS
jgi:hypothetical protein